MTRGVSLPFRESLTFTLTLFFRAVAALSPVTHDLASRARLDWNRISGLQLLLENRRYAPAALCLWDLEHSLRGRLRAALRPDGHCAVDAESSAVLPGSLRTRTGLRAFSTQIMLALAIIDIIALWVNAISFGALMLEGGSYCTHQVFNHYNGAVGTGEWITVDR